MVKITTLISAISNFSSQYNFQSIAVALIMMSVEVCTSDSTSCIKGKQADWVYGLSSAASFVGAILGQLSMGFFGDVVGRNKALYATLSISAWSALLSGLAPYGSPETIYTVIIISRFFLGFGVGGVYPLGAVKSSEDSELASGTAFGIKKVDSMSSAWSVFWLIPGTIAPWVVGYVLECITWLPNSYRWRILLSAGSVPSVAAIILLTAEEQFELGVYNRINNIDNLHEANKLINTRNPSTAYSTVHGAYSTVSMYSTIVHDNTTGLDNNLHLDTYKSKFHGIREAFEDKSNISSLIATGGAWFCFDAVSYGVTLLGGIILNDISSADNISDSSTVKYLAIQQMTAFAVSLPFSLLALYALPYLGLRNLQITSFIVMTMVFIIFGVLFNILRRSGDTSSLFVLYCSMSAGIYSGCKMTTYALPAVLFKKEIRSSFNGFACAIGKLGAVFGALTFTQIAQQGSYETLMGVSSTLALLGATLTFYFADERKLHHVTRLGRRRHSLAPTMA